ncbi:hypothetical protein ACLOJK_018508 [Asimina triloba]
MGKENWSLPEWRRLVFDRNAPHGQKENRKQFDQLLTVAIRIAPESPPRSEPLLPDLVSAQNRERETSTGEEAATEEESSIKSRGSRGEICELSSDSEGEARE